MEFGLYLPTQGFNHRNLCHSMQSYTATRSLPPQLQVVLKSVPSMSNTARRQIDGEPAQPFVDISTEHACS